MKKKYFLCSLLIIPIILLCLSYLPKELKGDKMTFEPLGKDELIIFTQNATSTIVELENNNLGKYIKMDFEVNIPIEGEYRISSILFGNSLSASHTVILGSGEVNPINILMATPHIEPAIKLDEGVQVISIYLLGLRMVNRDTEGPYQVDVVISRVKDDFYERARFTIKDYKANQLE